MLVAHPACPYCWKVGKATTSANGPSGTAKINYDPGSYDPYLLGAEDAGWTLDWAYACWFVAAWTLAVGGVFSVEGVSG